MKSYWVIFALAALPPTFAGASQFQHVPGAACVSNYNTDDTTTRGPTLLVWSQYGESLACPIQLTTTSVNPTAVNPTTARVDYVDSNSTPGALYPGAIRCQLTIATSTNSVVSSAYVYSCATPGGCATGDNSYTGTNYITFADTIASTANVVGMSVNCNVPGYDAATFAPSGIIGVGASTSTP